jgi:hypothetical protein
MLLNQEDLSHCRTDQALAFNISFFNCVTPVQPTVAQSAIAYQTCQFSDWGYTQSGLELPGVRSYRSKARTRKAAICARVTELVGQYNGGLPLHPKVMPRTAISSM